MSAYNGAEFIQEQLDSILAQTLFQNKNWQIELIIRDDGSDDKTPEILQDYSDKYSFVTYYTGKNKGVIASFFELIQNVPDDVDYVALSDQDDVWMKDKMMSAVSKLEQIDSPKPLLYCGRVLLTDEKLNPIPSIMFAEHMRPSFGNALVENICTGCTAVFNRHLVSLVKLESPAFTVMHDWWLYILAAAFGDVIFDSEPHMYYRQHMGNTVGVKRNYASEFLARLRRFRKNRYNISRQVAALQAICEKHSLSLTSEKTELMKEILLTRKHLTARLRIIKKQSIYRQRKMDNLLFKIIYLTGTI